VDEAIGDVPVDRLAPADHPDWQRGDRRDGSGHGAERPGALQKHPERPGQRPEPRPEQQPRGAAGQLSQPGGAATPPLAARLPAVQHGLAGPQARLEAAQSAAGAAGSLEALCEAIRAFTGCALRDTAGHTLCPEGPADAGLLLIGEVPGPDEDRTGRLFAGAPGELLDRMLGSIGLDRAALLAAPLVPWRPPGDRKVSPTEMALCLPFLHRLVALCRPRRLLLLGVRPARALLGEEPFGRLRGRWRDAAVPGCEMPLPALAMRHPSFLLANPASRRDAWSDLLLLRTTLDDDPPRPQAA